MAVDAQIAKLPSRRFAPISIPISSKRWKLPFPYILSSKFCALGGTKEKMVGWHHRLNGRNSEQTPGDSWGLGSLACCSPCSVQESDITERLNKQQPIRWEGKKKIDLQLAFLWWIVKLNLLLCLLRISLCFIVNIPSHLRPVCLSLCWKTLGCKTFLSAWCGSVPAESESSSGEGPLLLDTVSPLQMNLRVDDFQRCKPEFQHRQAWVTL